MAIADDLSVDKDMNIRWTGGESTYYTVLQLHRFLGGLADDEEASGDDLVDITSDTPSERKTDNIVELQGDCNIDDTVARHLYNGSVSQYNGDTLYGGLRVLGVNESGTELIIIQDNKVLPAYWGTGINADAANQVVMQTLIKVREGGADIDGKRIMVLARELGDKYAEFPVTMGLANSVAAITTTPDLNNDTAESTIEGWSTITNVEGYQLIDIDGNTVDEEYYSQFDKGSQSLNDVYEYTKWVSQRSHTVDSCSDTGSDFTVDNATILGQGQEFTANDKTEKLTEARFQIKIGAGTPTGTLVAELYDSDDASPAAPTGSVLATSEPVIASLITSTYKEVIFRFNDNITLTASQTYFIVIRHADGDASNYFQVKGLATTGTHAGNRAEDTGSWTGDADDDLYFVLKSSPVWFGRAGEKFRGITHEIVYDTESGGPFTENEIIFWGTAVTYDGLSGTFEVGEYVIFENAGTLVNGGKVLKDTGTILTVALEDITGSTLADGYTITGLSSAATATIDTTIANQDKSGGEGVLLALDDNGADGDFYIQLISGQAPVDDLPIEGRTSGATAAVNATVNARTINPEFIGQSTGTNLIGAYGIGFDVNDIGSSDKFFDLTNTQRVPPNNVTFTITGLVSGEDRVLVGPRSAGVLDKTQLELGDTLDTGSETSIICTTTIPSDTPADGTSYNTRLRVELDTGIWKRQAYTSYSGTTFTIPSTDYSGTKQATIGNNLFLAYIDVLADAATESYTAVYSTDRDLFVRVRDGGATPIKTFESEATFGSSASSVAAIRQSDS